MKKLAIISLFLSSILVACEAGTAPELSNSETKEYHLSTDASDIRGRGFNNEALHAYYLGFRPKPEDMCPAKFTEKAMYDHVAHIEDVELRQAEFFLRMALCLELTDNRDLAVLYAMRTINLADVLGRDMEAERVALSFLAEQDVDGYVDFGWANKKMSEKKYTIYGLGDYSLRVSEGRYRRRLEKFESNNARYFGNRYK